MTDTESTNLAVGFWKAQDIENYKNTQYWPAKENILKIIQEKGPITASKIEEVFKDKYPEAKLTTNNIWCVIINLYRQKLIRKNVETLEYFV